MYTHHASNSQHVSTPHNSRLARLFLLLLTAALVGLPQPLSASTFSPTTTTFAPTPVASTSAPQLVTLVLQSAGSSSGPSVLTEGSSDPTLAEFTVSNPGTCGSQGSFSAGQSCTASVTFTPRLPGMRHGAVQLRDSDHQLLASTLISGVGRGSLPVLIPAQIDTVAGTAQWFYQGDGGPASQSPIYLPAGLAVDGAGNLFLADSINNRVRRVVANTDPAQRIITTVAGNGSAGSGGDGGPAVSASISGPTGLALDGAGNLYIADTGNNVIRRVDAVSGIITTVAGTMGSSGYSGDGALATAAHLDAPQGLALSPTGDLLIADTGNNVIRVVTLDDGKIQTVAGTGTAGFHGDGGQATSAQFNQPVGVAFRADDGAFAVADLGNNWVRLVNPNGIITTIAGDTHSPPGSDGPPMGILAMTATQPTPSFGIPPESPSILPATWLSQTAATTASVSSTAAPPPSTRSPVRLAMIATPETVTPPIRPACTAPTASSLTP